MLSVRSLEDLAAETILAKVTATLTTAERNTHAVLYGAPKGIGSGQTGIYQSRRSYQQLQLQLQQLQQILGWVRLGQRIWLRRSRPFSMRRSPYLRR
ncbi:MAG: hypothetical protein HC899_18495 [Leptolyngbyaceae cyanobacterium SM1_4_3]|nr:hypothetical protein [Leptolyngbyaceae cyanobacterium SM1_4_3]